VFLVTYQHPTGARGQVRLSAPSAALAAQAARRRLQAQGLPVRILGVARA
jgi:hypothetical protein